jgi:hypothetical protein
MRAQSLSRLFVLLLFLLTTLIFVKTAELRTEPMTSLRFSISFSEASSHEPLDGRMLARFHRRFQRAAPSDQRRLEDATGFRHRR